MADNVLLVQIDLERGDTKTAFNGIEKDAKRAGKTVGLQFSKGFSGVFDVLAGNLGAILIANSIRGIKNELSGLVQSASNIEVIETQFKTLLKSTAAAQKQIKDLQEFAATTPFQLEGLSLATRQLLSFGVAQEAIIPTLRQIGDLAAGTGSAIDELTIPYGRLISTQKLTLVELDKFADRGINLYGALSKATGISLKNIRDEISKGRVPFEEFIKALNDLTKEGGLFFGATEKQSKTLNGVLSTLDDNADQLRASFGGLFSPLIKQGAIELTKSIQELNKQVQAFNLNAALKSFSEFNELIVELVILPLELLVNLSKFVGLKVAEGLNAIVASLGFVGGKIAEFLNFLGVDGLTGLKAFAESSNEVFVDSANKANQAYNGIFDFPFSDKLAAANETLRSGLAETNAIVDDSALKAKNSLNGIGGTVVELAKETSTIMKGAFTKAISGSIQTVIKSISAGQDAFKALGNFLFNIFGDLAIQLGEFFIAQGIAVEALKAVNGAAAIAAGAGLIALGSLLKSFGSGGGSESSSSGGGTLGSTFQNDNNLAEPDNIERQTQSQINITVEGSLVQQEELGSFISKVISEGNEKNGNIILNPRFA